MSCIAIEIGKSQEINSHDDTLLTGQPDFYISVCHRTNEFDLLSWLFPHAVNNGYIINKNRIFSKAFSFFSASSK